MTNKFITALCACLLSITALAFGIRAEEYEDAPVEAPPAAVEPTPAQEAPPPAAEDAARVPVEFDAEALAEALTQAMATPTPDPDATPTPTPQIIVIQATPETAPTPEPTTAPTIWNKKGRDGAKAQRDRRCILYRIGNSQD